MRLEEVSVVEENVLRTICQGLSRASDYWQADVRRAVNLTLQAMVRYLKYRMDMTRGHDPDAAFLFKDTEWVAKTRTKDKALSSLETKPTEQSVTKQRDAFEAKLQMDCHRFLKMAGVPASLEDSDIAAGRADILVKFPRVPIVIEVKHEEKDASISALKAKYGAQATEYQATGPRIGFLLVLDRARNDGGVGHISDNIVLTEVERPGDTNTRILILMTMPAGRKIPSQQKLSAESLADAGSAR